MKTLKERLADWMDWDGAEYELGVVLGLWPEFGGPTGWTEVKGVIWSNTPVGNALADTLRRMADAGVLETRNDNQEYRWKPTEKEGATDG